MDCVRRATPAGQLETYAICSDKEPSIEQHFCSQSYLCLLSDIISHEISFALISKRTWGSETA